jgi:hypothetical protein
MSNARLQITDLDFDTIKTNLKNYLKQQSQFTDYDFEGSGLNILLDVLAYNTHYNAYYLNMIANESFLDTAILRDSVVSHAKTLNYIPFSMTAAKAIINVTVETGSTQPGTLDIPRGFTFFSEILDNKSYRFVLLEAAEVTKTGTTFQFENLEIYEGQFVSYNFGHNSLTNPKSVFVLPDSNIDTKTIKVVVSPNLSNTATEVYNQVNDILDVTADSNIYFLQESRGGRYQIYFGDGVIGKSLQDGSTVTVSYLTTSGDAANKVTSFVAASGIDNYTDITSTTLFAASGGSQRESIDSIKFSTQSQFTTQNRLVTFKDYETYLLQNYPNLESVSVWGGEDESEPVYGKVFISLKPKANYYISEKEKQRIIDEIIKPKAIVSTDVIIRDPEYLYIVINNVISYDSKKTTASETSLTTSIRDAILTYNNVYLNKFDSRFVLSKLQENIAKTNINAIIGSRTDVSLQKRFTPTLNVSKNYTINFNSPLRRGTINNKLVSSAFNVLDINGVERQVQFEEIPQSFSGISYFNVTNPGTGYVVPPTVTITGDGTGASAIAIVVNGKIQRIDIVSRGIDYTRAIVTISGGDGYGGEADAVIDARTGTLRTVYYDTNAQRQIVDAAAGTVEYETGTIYIKDINIRSVISTDGRIRMTTQAEKTIINTLRNTIITIDEDDPTAIITTLELATF